MKNTKTAVLGLIAVLLTLAFIACDDGSGLTGTAPAITTASLPGGTVGTAYSQTLAATGDAPITWSIDTGALPGGLTLSTAGVIAGTPETANTFNFTVKATNAAGSGTKALSIAIASSKEGGDTLITIAAIEGVTAPVQGATPVTAITANDQYEGTVAWNGTPATFAYATAYTATITLTPKSGYTLQGVSANFFTVAGATASNAANSGVITAVFPQTANDPSLSDLTGTITISPNTSVTTGTELTATYSGGETVSYQWKKDGNNVGTASTTNPNKFTPTEAGSYTVTVSATGYNPKTSAAVNVTAAVTLTVITIKAIAGVTAPVQGATPVTAITANDQYTGTVAWNGTPATFAYDTVYTATITLTAKTGYTLQGVTEDFFTVAGADSVSNAANSGIVTAVFPQTEDDPTLADLSGDVSISPNTDVKTHTQLTATYSESEAVSFQWQKNGNNIGTASTTNPNTYTPTEEGSYTVIVSLAGYNSKSATVTVTTADLAGSITISPNNENGNVVTINTQLSAAYSGSEAVSFQWHKDDNDIGTASTTNPNTYAPTEAGSYTVTVSATGYNPKTSDPVTVVTLTGITALYNGTATIDYTTPIEDLKTDLTVTAQYSDDTSIPVTDYELSGTLTANTSAITVTWEDETTTFTVTSFAVFTDVAAMTAFLSSQDSNTAATAYNIRLNVATLPWSSSGQALTAFSSKYVNLDLSGSTLTTIGSSAFSNNSRLTGITIPEGVTSIGNSAFSGCSYLSSVTIAEGVTSIGDSAFYNCSSLTSITIPASVTTFANGSSTTGVFRSCTGLTSITFASGSQLTTIGDYMFNGCNRLTGITIPNSVKTIGSYAFIGCTRLTSVTFASDSQLTTIGGYVFENCTGLASVTIPNSVTSIGSSAFNGCTGLTGITFAPGSQLTTISNGTFNGCNRLTSVTIPEGVTSIGNSAFNGCTRLASVTIPASVTSIGSSAFRDCTSLTGITIPNSVTSIGSSTFNGCTGLTGITIPNSVTTIGEYAFNGCTRLASVTIPEGVTSIGDRAFNDCTGLVSVTFAGTIASGSFSSTATFPGDLRTKYLDASGGIGTYTRPSSSSTTWTKS